VTAPESAVAVGVVGPPPGGTEKVGREACFSVKAPLQTRQSLIARAKRNRDSEIKTSKTSSGTLNGADQGG
jgi:hypothetical protein